MIRIILISGHGAGDPGAVAAVDGVVYKESAEAEALVKKIAERLKAYECEVFCYDFAANAYADWKNGTLQLPSADALLEVHFNACAADAGDGRIKGCEAFVHPSSGGESRKLASAMVAAVCGAAELTLRGVKQGQYAVIGAAEKARIPSTLLEVCFLDDADDLRQYLPRRDAIADAIAEELAAFAGAAKKEICEAPRRAEEPCPPWAENACAWAVAQGLFQGNGTGFCWNGAMTRQELAVVLQRFARKFAMA